jgi:hypothetical protein
MPHTRSLPSSILSAHDSLTLLDKVGDMVTLVCSLNLDVDVWTDGSVIPFYNCTGLRFVSILTAQ